VTSYTPPTESGLRSADAHLSERIERHATPTDAHRPGVYAIVLSVPDDVRARWEQTYDVVPDYLERVEAAARTCYVGAATDVYERLRDHVEGDVRQTALTRVCPPHTIHDIWLFDDPDRAFEREHGLAMDLDQERPRWYVHAR